MSFEEALSDYSVADPVLSKISHLAAGCNLITEFILENEDHFEQTEKTNNAIELIMDELKEIKEELREIKKRL